MIEHVMNTMGGGIAVFGIISICIFFAFFSGMLLWALLLKKPYLNSMRELPLEGEFEPAVQHNSELETIHEQRC